MHMHVVFQLKPYLSSPIVTGHSSECVVSERQHRLRVGPVGDCLGEELLDVFPFPRFPRALSP